MKFNTKTIHGGQIEEKGYGAVMPPIYQTSTYSQKSPGDHKGYEYSRTHNPTRSALEKSLASIESGEFGLAFGSGLAAIDCVLRTLNPGDEVIAGDDLYGGTYRMFTRLFEKYGLEFSYVDMNIATNVKEAITEKTKLVWIKLRTLPTRSTTGYSPSNYGSLLRKLLTDRFPPSLLQSKRCSARCRTTLATEEENRNKRSGVF